MIVSIDLASSNLQKKNLSHSPKQHMENIHFPTIKKHKTSLFITSVMEAEEISMLLPMKAETVILINGETKQDINSKVA